MKVTDYLSIIILKNCEKNFEIFEYDWNKLREAFFQGKYWSYPFCLHSILRLETIELQWRGIIVVPMTCYHCFYLELEKKDLRMGWFENQFNFRFFFLSYHFQFDFNFWVFILLAIQFLIFWIFEFNLISIFEFWIFEISNVILLSPTGA